MMIQTASNNDEKRRHYFVWKCLKKRDCTALGKERTTACGRWNTKTSKHALGAHEHLKGNCKFCGNAPRLNLHPFVKVCDTKWMALKLADALNEQQDRIQEERSEDGQGGR